MKQAQLEKLAQDDRHGVYEKENGDRVLLPVKRHSDWTAKGMKFITCSDNVDSDEVKKAIKESRKEREARAAMMLEKYGEEIIKDMPSLYTGLNINKLKSSLKKKKPAQ